MEQWITLIPANTIILDSFKCKSNLLGISSQRATNIYLLAIIRANKSWSGSWSEVGVHSLQEQTISTAASDRTYRYSRGEAILPLFNWNSD